MEIMEVIKYFKDRFIGADLEKGQVNSRNEVKNYQRMEGVLLEELCKRRIKEEEQEKKGSLIRTPKSKPIDKKNFMNNIQNEIEVRKRGIRK